MGYFDELTGGYHQELFNEYEEALVGKVNSEYLKALYDYSAALHIFNEFYFNLFVSPYNMYKEMVEIATDESVVELEKVFNTYVEEKIKHLELVIPTTEEKLVLDEILNTVMEELESKYVQDEEKIVLREFNVYKEQLLETNEHLYNEITAYPFEVIQQAINSSTTMDELREINNELDFLLDLCEEYNYWHFDVLKEHRYFLSQEYSNETYGYFPNQFSYLLDTEIEGFKFKEYVYLYESIVDEMTFLYYKHIVVSGISQNYVDYELVVQMLEAATTKEEIDEISKSKEYLLVSGGLQRHFDETFVDYADAYNDYYTTGNTMYPYNDYIDILHAYSFNGASPLTFDYDGYYEMIDTMIIYTEEMKTKYNSWVELQDEKSYELENLDPSDPDEAVIIQMIENAKSLEELEEIRNSVEYKFVKYIYLSAYNEYYNTFSPSISS